jgi:hypothetical protein
MTAALRLYIFEANSSDNREFSRASDKHWARKQEGAGEPFEYMKKNLLAAFLNPESSLIFATVAIGRAKVSQ